MNGTVLPDVRDALFGVKAELEGTRAALENARRDTKARTSSSDSFVEDTVAEVRAMTAALRDPSGPIERRRDVLRRLLPTRNGERPIRIQFDFAAGKEWGRAMKRATVRHLSLIRGGLAQRGEDAVAPKLVAGAVAADAGQLVSPGWGPGEAFGLGERERGFEQIEKVGELVGVAP